MCFQFSPCILDDVFVFFITWINRINTPQTTGILEFWCAVRVSTLDFLFFERLFQFLSKLQAIYDLDVSSFEFLSVSHQTTYILLDVSLSID